MPATAATKKLLSDTMKQLMREKPFRKISVGELCSRCHMSRKSFYYHFCDKYDLINRTFEAEFLTAARSNIYDSEIDFFADICRYLHENREFYSAAFAIEGQNCFSDYFSSALRPLAEYHISHLVEDKRQSGFFADFFMDGFRQTIVRWLNGAYDYTPDEFIRTLTDSFYVMSLSIVKNRDSEKHA